MAGSTRVLVQPDEDDPLRFASVAVLDEGGYEIVRRDTTRNEHEVTTATSTNGIAHDLYSVRPPAPSPDGRPVRSPISRTRLS